MQLHMPECYATAGQRKSGHLVHLGPEGLLTGVNCRACPSPPTNIQHMNAQIVAHMVSLKSGSCDPHTMSEKPGLCDQTVPLPSCIMLNCHPKLLFTDKTHCFTHYM